MIQYFPNIVAYSFTAEVEKELDEVAEGKMKWQKMIQVFYNAFHKTVEDTSAIERSTINPSRELGIDPKTGLKIYAKLGRYGPYVQLGELVEGEEKPKYASLRKGQFIESLTLEEALELFKLPRELGLFEEETMTVAIGRFGPYIKHAAKFYSIPKEEDPLEITPERAIEIIQAKRKAEAEKVIKLFPENPDIQILNGRYGPYITSGKKNVKIPKDRDPKTLTLEECLDLIEKAPEKKKRGWPKKKS